MRRCWSSSRCPSVIPRYTSTRVCSLHGACSCMVRLVVAKRCWRMRLLECVCPARPSLRFTYVLPGTRGTFHQHLRPICRLWNVGRVRKDPAGYLRGGETNRPVFALHRRDRCYHAQTRERAKGDGETDSRSIPHMHGWCVEPRARYDSWLNASDRHVLG